MIEMLKFIIGNTVLSYGPLPPHTHTHTHTDTYGGLLHSSRGMCEVGHGSGFYGNWGSYMRWMWTAPFFCRDLKRNKRVLSSCRQSRPIVDSIIQDGSYQGSGWLIGRPICLDNVPCSNWIYPGLRSAQEQAEQSELTPHNGLRLFQHLYMPPLAHVFFWTKTHDVYNHVWWLYYNNNNNLLLYKIVWKQKQSMWMNTHK